MYVLKTNFEADYHLVHNVSQGLVDNLKKTFPEEDLDLLQSLCQLLESKCIPNVDSELRH